MFLELTITIFVAAYIILVAVGHVLLFAALLRYLREDSSDGRTKRTAADRGPPDRETKRLPMRSSTARAALAHDCRDIEPWQAAHAARNFAEQRQALGRDLRYVVTVTGSKC